MKQRSRGRNLNGGNKGRMVPRNATFDSNGPEIRVRGNAHQVLEKYLGMARDASSQGDRIAAENYYQHAEHYFRMINSHNQHNGGRNGGQRPMATPADDQLQLDAEAEAEAEAEENAVAEAEDAEENVEDGENEAVRA